jgi:chromosome segregation ATPase
MNEAVAATLIKGERLQAEAAAPASGNDQQPLVGAVKKKKPSRKHWTSKHYGWLKEIRGIKKDISVTVEYIRDENAHMQELQAVKRGLQTSLDGLKEQWAEATARKPANLAEVRAVKTRLVTAQAEIAAVKKDLENRTFSVSAAHGRVAELKQQKELLKANLNGTATTVVADNNNFKEAAI